MVVDAMRFATFALASTTWAAARASARAASHVPPTFRSDARSSAAFPTDTVTRAERLRKALILSKSTPLPRGRVSKTREEDRRVRMDQGARPYVFLWPPPCPASWLTKAVAYALVQSCLRIQLSKAAHLSKMSARFVGIIMRSLPMSRPTFRGPGARIPHKSPKQARRVPVKPCCLTHLLGADAPAPPSCTGLST